MTNEKNGAAGDKPAAPLLKKIGYKGKPIILAIGVAIG
jgi:hypothetical protein